MTLRYCLIFILYFLTTSLAAGQDHTSIEERISWSSDFKSLEEHIKNKIIYPEDARYKGIQGIVYVQFKVDSSGNLIKNTVRTLFGLSPSCDLEAERVIRLYNKKWTVHTGNETAMQQPFIVPIKFVLTDDGVTDFPSHILNPPVRTIVLPKSTKASALNWSVYRKKGFENSIGTISPGDSVTVIGWAAWCYFIQARGVVGYISNQALQINSAMEVVAKTLQENSATEEEAEQKVKELKRNRAVDTVRNFSVETAHLSLTASKKSIFVGECTTITMAFNVRNDNRLKIQFYELGPQLSKIIATDMNVDHAFVVNNNIDNIEGEETTINGQIHTTYKIYQAAYCPNQEQQIRFPATKLKMIIWKHKDEEIEKIAEFNSLPVVVKVKPLPPLNLTNYNRYKMVGKFSMEEKVEEKSITVGKPFIYQVRVSGEGLIFPLEPPELNYTILRADLREIQNNDTIINEVLHSDKTFTYRIIPMKEGDVDLNNRINYSFYDPSTNKKETISSSMKITVSKGEKGESQILPEKATYASNNFIAIDASQSMMIEDYQPYRLHVVKEGIKKFLQKRTGCDVGIIAFSGEAHLVRPGSDNYCYSSTDMDGITFLAKSGTAIGDAIWLARISIKPGDGAKKIVIIGDGDNTAGSISPLYAAELAKKSNIRIYTIGIGDKGPVPYGRDDQGRPYMITNTFSDNDFRKISQLTGGKYYHAKKCRGNQRNFKSNFS